MTKVIVTGASGYIGGHVVEALKMRGFEVSSLSRVGGQEGHYRCLESAKIDTLAGHFSDSRHVIHLAGRLVDDVRAGVMDYVPANVALTSSVLEAAKICGVTSVVHASSRLVYPRTLTRPAREDRDRNPDTAYGLSKAWAEDLMRLAALDDGLSTISLRLAQVTGGEHHGLGVINSFLDQARRNARVTIHGEGRARRNFVHVQDVAAAFVAALAYRGSWTAVNIGGTRGMSVAEIAQLVARTVTPTAQVTYRQEAPEDLSCYELDGNRASKTLGWRPQRTPEQIIAESAAMKKG